MDIIVRKNDVDQSSSRGDVKDNRYVVACGHIICVRRNITGVSYVCIIIPGVQFIIPLWFVVLNYDYICLSLYTSYTRQCHITQVLCFVCDLSILHISLKLTSATQSTILPRKTVNAEAFD